MCRHRCIVVADQADSEDRIHCERKIGVAARQSQLINASRSPQTLTAAGVVPGRTNLVQASTDLFNQVTISTNTVATNHPTTTDYAATKFAQRFYRLAGEPS